MAFWRDCWRLDKKIRMGKDIKAIAVDFITKLQHRESADDIIEFYHPNVKQVEFPNALNSSTVIRNLEQLKEASEKGKLILKKEEYEILHSYAFDNNVILEVMWTGTLAIPLGNIPAGGQMKAHFAQFYEFKDGKIIRQRNYDCFEAFK